MYHCKVCGKKSKEILTYYDNYICSKCAESKFVCPECANVFDEDDYTNGDAGTGLCVKCEKNSL